MLPVVLSADSGHHIRSDEREFAFGPTDAVHEALRAIIDGPPLPTLQARKASHSSPRARSTQPSVAIHLLPGETTNLAVSHFDLLWREVELPLAQVLCPDLTTDAPSALAFLDRGVKCCPRSNGGIRLRWRC